MNEEQNNHDELLKYSLSIMKNCTVMCFQQKPPCEKSLKQVGSSLIFKSDIDKLENRLMIGDETINAVLYLVFGQNNTASKSKFRVCSTHFMNQDCEVNEEILLRNNKGELKPLRKTEVLFVPCNYGKHWFPYIVDQNLKPSPFEIPVLVLLPKLNN